jgi:prepilin peptidase CpaA
MSSIASFLLAILLAVAAVQDVRSRRIPNWLVAGTALLALASLASVSPANVPSHLGVALAVLAAGMVVWRCGWLGGGDVKLVAALALWAGPAHVGDLLVATVLAGGLLAMGVVVARMLAARPAAMAFAIHLGALVPASWSGRAPPRSAKPPTLPYGVAVAAAGLWLAHRLAA